MSDYSYSTLVEMLEQAGVATEELAAAAEVLQKALDNLVPMGYAKTRYQQLIDLIPALWPCKKKSPVCEEDVPELLEELQDLLVEVNDEIVEPLQEKHIVKWQSSGSDILLVRASDFSVNLNDPSGIDLLTLYNSATSFPRQLLVNDGDKVIAIKKIFHPTFGEFIISQGYDNDQIKIWKYNN